MRTIAIRRTAGLATALLLVIMFAVGVDQAVADPAGNNGTVKVDGVEFDSHPNNEPHVGCVFQVDFYGYDEGDLYADVTFTAQAPTQPAGEVILADSEIFIGEDPAGGGTDLDAERTYDLTTSLEGFTAHDVQGYHIKLTVNADGSIGADVKHKVFWVECESPTTSTTEGTTSTTEGTTSTTEGTTSTTEGTTSTTEGTTSTTEGTTSTTEGTTSTTEGTTPPEAEEVTTTTTIPPDVSSSSTSTTVAPSTTAPPSTSPATSPTTLPFTGVESDTMALMAFLAMAAGAGLVGLTRDSVESQSDRID